MNSRQLWNSNQRHKFLRAKASRGILKFSVSEIAFRGFQEVFSTTDTMLFRRNTHKTGNYAVEMSQAFHNIAQFEWFTDLNLFKYAFNIIQNQEMDALHFIRWCVFLLAVMVEGDESSRLRMPNQPAVLFSYRPLLTALPCLMQIFLIEITHFHSHHISRYYF